MQLLFWLYIYAVFHRMVSFHRLSGSLGQPVSEVEGSAPAIAKGALSMHKVAIGLQKHWLHTFKCLVWTLAMARICRKNQWPYLFYLGVKKNKNKLVAHSWIVQGKLPLTGHQQEDYQVVAIYKYPPAKLP